MEKMKDYYYEDFKALSKTAREVWLAEQCSAFETELQQFVTERDMENFVEELYKKLKQVTRRWQSWNHRSFGGVTSRGYVAELLSWEKYVRFRGIIPFKPNLPESNALEKFEIYCQRLEELQQLFQNGIYKPLVDFFQEDEFLKDLNSIPKDLENVLGQWITLLSSGVINEKLFTASSLGDIFAVTMKNRCHDFDLVLRLVPDLSEKAFEALRLARRWRLIRRASVSKIRREDTYTVSKENSMDSDESKKGKRKNSKILNRVKELEAELEQSQIHNKALREELANSNEKCCHLEEQLSNYKQQCKLMENELEKVRKKCEVLTEKLIFAKKDARSTTEELEASQEHCRLIQKELNTAKIKYCAQKIRFINAKKRCSLLSNELHNTKEELKSLESELEESNKRCHALKVQLENTKRNIFTQGNMLDVLQNQCFTLKKELDGSKAKCLQLTCELEKSQEQCVTLEKELDEVKDEVVSLNTELVRSKKREELLIQQNSQLRKYFLEKGHKEPKVPRNSLHKPQTDVI